MKKQFIFFIGLFSSSYLQAQNIGIGTSTPQQKLEINGAVKIGTTNTNQPGTIRFNTGIFEGGNGSTWKSFEGMPSKAIILARTVDTSELKLVGFNVYKQSTLEDTFHFSVTTNEPGQWEDLPAINPLNEPQGIYNFESVQYNNKLIYYNYLGELYQFDVSTQQWSQLPGTSPLSSRLFYSMTLVGNEIFIFGGAVFNPFTGNSDGAKYNLTTNTWSLVTNMPVISFYHASCAIANDIYIVGGASALTPAGYLSLNKKMYKYNTITNSWSADLSNSNTPILLQGNAHERNSKIVLVGLDSIREYNPSSNSYTNLYPIIVSNNPLLASINFVSNIVQDKVNIFGNVSDTIFQTNTSLVPLHLQINLLNGQSVSLNSCNTFQPVSNFTYQYINTLNKFYAKNGDGNATKLFNPAGSIGCTNSGFANTFLYYMKKQ